MTFTNLKIKNDRNVSFLETVCYNIKINEISKLQKKKDD